MTTLLLILLAIAAVLLFIFWLKNDRLKNMNHFLKIGFDSANKELAYQKESSAGYRNTTGKILYERMVRIRELEAQVTHMSGIICPHESHIWDDVGDGVKRCRRCGVERRTDDARS